MNAILSKIKSWVVNTKALGVDLKFLDTEKKTILIIDDDLPQYDKSSGSRRLFELLKLFKQLNLNVVFFPSDGKKVEPYYSELIGLGIDVLLNEEGSKNNTHILKSIRGKVDYAWISRPMLNIKFRKLLKANRKIKIIFDTVDLHFVRMLRQAENEKNERLVKKAQKFKKIELMLAENADVTLTVTNSEKTLLENEGIKNVYVIPNIHALNVPKIETPFIERKGIVFIGGYKHEPNVDAVKWLIQDIMPIVWDKLGRVPIHLLGSFPTTEVKALVGPDVYVPGFLENVDPYFLNARVFVAPLRYGAGMKGKIGQSLELGLPIVSTTIGVEGMDLIHDKNVLLGDDTIDFARQIINLYEDSELWTRIKENAYSSIINYAPTSVLQKLKGLLEELELD
ncbi:glycosyltransferase [Pedobacter sp. MW01-1-1]|uniref:glycosyltransferase n=1 Tax=Pedobacter sp. MW01-1-1 TaxID=3383027 RepID=UPI003FED976D